MMKEPAPAFRTGFLFARPSFLEGIARLLDFGNTLTEYNTSPSGEAADYYAMQSDWEMVGQDLWSGIHQFEQAELTRSHG